VILLIKCCVCVYDILIDPDHEDYNKIVQREDANGTLIRCPYCWEAQFITLCCRESGKQKPYILTLT
jgi:hypothetical protein